MGGGGGGGEQKIKLAEGYYFKKYTTLTNLFF